MAKLLVLIALLQQTTPAPDLNESLWEAARSGDTVRISAALDKGPDINAKAPYEMTALLFAADNGRLDAVKLLVARGADVNARETFYHARAVDLALNTGYVDVAIFLLQNGSKGGDDALTVAVQSNDAALVRAALASDVTRQGLQSAMALAERTNRADLSPIIKAALDARPAEPEPAPVAVDPATLRRYAGTYRNEASGVTMTAAVEGGSLVAQMGGQTFRLFPTGEGAFRASNVQNLTVSFDGRGGMIESATVGQVSSTVTLARAADIVAAAPARTPPTPARPAASSASSAPPPRAAARNWPSFRGESASGNGDGQRAVAEWDTATGKNVKWKTPIPGTANSSPIIWGSRVFVTTAVSRSDDKGVRTGAYGDVKPLDDLSEHEWKLYSVDKTSGAIVWERTAFAGAPKTKRHPKASQANSTPATDGQHIVAAFGSVGLLVAWDMNGNELWRDDIGVVDSGWFLDPTYQWGHGSSPVIYRNMVILQADMQKGSYLAAWDLASGKQVWKTIRADEISTWGTPTIVRTIAGRDELVTNGTKIRGYDPATGKSLWTLGPSSEITIATPVAGHGLVYVVNGYPPVRPIYAVRPGATGDISLPAGKDSTDAIRWSNKEGTYIPTPLVYGDYLYTCNNNGVVTAYDAETGQSAFRGRVGVGGAFSASPIAADGRLYIASEDGEVFVVSAGPDLKQIASNDMHEVIMATPAISDGLIVIRTLGHLYGIGE
jgi:hypothetical protein